MGKRGTARSVVPQLDGIISAARYVIEDRHMCIPLSRIQQKSLSGAVRLMGLFDGMMIKRVI